jgi:hypothetical protein
MAGGFLFGACSQCCEGCRGSCDDENPCAEGCCCCDGRCVNEAPCAPQYFFYVNDEIRLIGDPGGPADPELDCWLPEIIPPGVLDGIEPTNTGYAWISLVAGEPSGPNQDRPPCLIAINWTSLACGTAGGTDPSPSGFATGYLTEWEVCGVNKENGRTVLRLVSVSVLFWPGQNEDLPPPEPDFSSLVVEYDCNPLP